MYSDEAAIEAMGRKQLLFTAASNQQAILASLVRPSPIIAAKIICEQPLIQVHAVKHLKFHSTIISKRFGISGERK